MRVGRLAVVVVWGVLLLALARGQWAAAGHEKTSAPPPAPAVADADDTWMGVYMSGQKVGYSHSRTTPVAEGYQLEETSLLRLSVMDQVQTVRAVIDATTTSDFAVRAFTVTLDSGLGAFAVRGTADDRTLVLQTGAGGDTSEQHLALGEPIYLPSSARARLRGAALEAGRSLTLQVFDPSAMEHQPLTMLVQGREALTVGGKTQQAWKVRETFRGMETSVWLDDDGRTLREEGPMGMVVQREDAAGAIGTGWGETAFDLMGAIAVHAGRPIADPRHLTHLTARVSGLGELPVPTDGRQSLRDGVLRIEREPTAPATYTLPYIGSEWRHELEATPFLQVDHPRIRDTARAILAGETDPRRAAERLRSWVYDELEKRPVASIPNALQVLDTRVGDCNEHAVLFAALARAAGLPARVVAGVVYADGAFLYHAWDEVWLGTGWMTVDPAFDQTPADATHVKLVEGGPETHAALIGVVGKLSIDVMPETAGSADS